MWYIQISHKLFCSHLTSDDADVDKGFDFPSLTSSTYSSTLQVFHLKIITGPYLTFRMMSLFLNQASNPRRRNLPDHDRPVLHSKQEAFRPPHAP